MKTFLDYRILTSGRATGDHLRNIAVFTCGAMLEEFESKKFYAFVFFEAQPVHQKARNIVAVCTPSRNDTFVRDTGEAAAGVFDCLVQSGRVVIGLFDTPRALWNEIHAWEDRAGSDLDPALVNICGEVSRMNLR